MIKPANTLDLGIVQVLSESTKSFFITNDGSGPLRYSVSDFISPQDVSSQLSLTARKSSRAQDDASKQVGDDDKLQTDFSEMTLNPAESIEFLVTFTPEVEAKYQATLHVESNGGNKSHHIFAQSAAFKLRNVIPDALHLGKMKIGEERKALFSIENGSIVPYPVQLSWGSFGEREQKKEDEAGTAELSIEEDGFDEQLVAGRRGRDQVAPPLSDGGFRVSHGSLELEPYAKGGVKNTDAKWSQAIEVHFAFPGIPVSPLLDTGGQGRDGDHDQDADVVDAVEAFVVDGGSSFSSSSISYPNLEYAFECIESGKVQSTLQIKLPTGDTHVVNVTVELEAPVPSIEAPLRTELLEGKEEEFDIDEEKGESRDQVFGLLEWKDVQLSQRVTQSFVLVNTSACEMPFSIDFPHDKFSLVVKRARGGREDVGDDDDDNDDNDDGDDDNDEDEDGVGGSGGGGGDQDGSEGDGGDYSEYDDDNDGDHANGAQGKAYDGERRGTKGGHGTVPPHSARKIQVSFKSDKVFDTSKVNKKLMVVRVKVFHGLMPDLFVAVRANTREYVFNTDLLQPINFGSAFVGSDPIHRSFILENVSFQDISYEIVVDPVKGPFNVHSSTRMGVIKARERSEVVLDFVPGADAVFSSTASIRSEEGEAHVELRGVGVEASIDVEPYSLDFGFVGVGCPVTETVSVTNTCGLPFDVFLGTMGALRVTSTSHKNEGGLFISTRKLSLQPGSTGQIDVTFSPTEQVLYEGSATFVVAGLKLSGGEAGDAGGIGFLEAQGYGGHIAVKTNPEVLDMKRCPMMVMRKSRIHVENVGNVSLDLKCTDSNLKDIGGAGRRYDAGSISINPIFLSLLPKQSAALTVSVTMRTVGEAEFGLTLSLQNTQGKQQWPIKVRLVVLGEEERSGGCGEGERVAVEWASSVAAGRGRELVAVERMRAATSSSPLLPLSSALAIERRLYLSLPPLFSHSPSTLTRTPPSRHPRSSPLETRSNTASR